MAERQPTHGDIQRDMGRMEGKQDATGARLDKLENAVSKGFDEVKDAITDMRSDFNTRLSAIEHRESQRKGAWAVIVTMSAAASGAVAWLVSYLFGKG